MKTHTPRNISLHALCALLLIVFLPAGTQAIVLLNEVMSNPILPESSAEFVELLNTGPHTISLEGYLLGDSEDLDDLVDTGQGFLLEPDQRALVLDPSYDGEYDEIISAGTLLLFNGDAAFGQGGWSNSQVEIVRLMLPDGTTADSLLSDPNLDPGISLERARGGANCQSCWKPTLQPGGTPGARNTRRLDPFAVELVDTNDEGVSLQALGEQGFSGVVNWRIGLGTSYQDLPMDLTLTFEEKILLPWPEPLIRGHNPLRLEAWPDIYPNRLLLDTLLASFHSPSLYLDELRTNGDEFLELLSFSEEPILLDALSLDFGSRQTQLSGTLWTSERLLVGELQSACQEMLQIIVPLTLPQAGHVDLLYEGARIPLGNWAMPSGVSYLQRISPALALEEPGSWEGMSTPTPGCPPSQPPQQKTGSLSLSSNTIFPERPGQHLLHIYAENSEFVEVWSLDGRLLRELYLSNNGVTWDGRDSKGRLLPSGIYLLQTSTEVLRPVALLW
jgi:hypothetical protein